MNLLRVERLTQMGDAQKMQLTLRKEPSVRDKDGLFTEWTVDGGQTREESEADSDIFGYTRWKCSSIRKDLTASESRGAGSHEEGNALLIYSFPAVRGRRLNHSGPIG